MRNLYYLLMTALYTAVALMQMQNVPVLIAQNLDFNVLGARDVTLQKDGIVSECSSSLCASLPCQRFEILGVANDAHASAAPAERSLNNEREPDLPRPRAGRRPCR